MIFSRFLVLCFSLLLLSSCDPEKVIVIKNFGKEPIHLDILFNDCEKPEAFSFLEGEHFANIYLGTDGMNMHIIHMGMGAWSDDEIVTVLDCIESIQVIKEGDGPYFIEGAPLKALKDASLKTSKGNTIELVIEDF